MLNAIEKIKLGQTCLSTDAVVNVEIASALDADGHGVVTSETIYNALSSLSADISRAMVNP